MVFIILLIISINKIKVLSETQVIDLTTAKAYYDIARLVYYPQYFILIFSLVRTVGFDIKKFNFEKDIKELELSKEDSEEFEFVVGIDFNNYLVQTLITTKVFSFVPKQNLTESWDDKKLYIKYGINDEEINFIKTIIKPMGENNE